ncbi:MAG: hypothetical protein A2046_13065 [Bacteroidetes bacterium GWA2_30_7]|nr:MAG: hypothetical protein A2046_13065 [Bacteroidetes bacterium GWA2_30_7]
MKKLSLTLAAVAFVAFTFTSCKKAYDCKCTWTGGSVTVNSGAKLSKKDAKTWCEGSYSGATTATCELQ